MTLSSYLEKEEQIEIIGIAKDGNEAYNMAMELKPDVLLLDIIMPHLDGLGVLEKLYEEEMEKKPVCIIFVFLVFLCLLLSFSYFLFYFFSCFFIFFLYSFPLLFPIFLY